MLRRALSNHEGNKSNKINLLKCPLRQAQDRLRQAQGERTELVSVSLEHRIDALPVPVVFQVGGVQAVFQPCSAEGSQTFA
jgi:hypothetical protein